MGLELHYSDGQTPIDEDEKLGLMISTISTKAELDEFEQLNIEEALQWINGKKFKRAEVFSQQYVCMIHRRMFGNVWSWAGKFRNTNKNIGVDKFEIPLSVRILCDDALFWVEHEVFPLDEIAIRFKHRLVSIHCFPNGNGRHSRLMADVIIDNLLGQPHYSWGSQGLITAGDARKAYIDAIQKADRGNLAPLIQFSRT
jgi:Fic-DOC domain mobile mystery protein B